MSGTLAGRTAVITGASRGIGRAIARRLAREGCDIAGIYRNSHDEAESLAEEIHGLGRRAWMVSADVSSPESLDECFDSLGREIDSVDFLVSNAASGVLRPALDMNLRHWRWCLETNALALDLLAQRAVPRMPRGSRIIALSSLGAARAMPGYAFVGASKAALESLVRSLAQELAPRGITVNAVSAGVVNTAALDAFPDGEGLRAEFRRRSPAGRVLEPEDVAGAVYLLCLPEATPVNGHTLVVDGGYSISG